jgi:hypothetical protein
MESLEALLWFLWGKKIQQVDQLGHIDIPSAERLETSEHMSLLVVHCPWPK